MFLGQLGKFLCAMLVVVLLQGLGLGLAQPTTLATTTSLSSGALSNVVSTTIMPVSSVVAALSSDLNWSVVNNGHMEAEPSVTITTINLIYVSYATVTDTLSQSTPKTTHTIIFDTTLTGSTTNTVVDTSTVIQKISTTSGFCYWEAEDMLTPCTTSVAGSAVPSRSFNSGSGSRKSMNIISNLYNAFGLLSNPSAATNTATPTSVSIFSYSTGPWTLYKKEYCVDWSITTLAIAPISIMIFVIMMKHLKNRSYEYILYSEGRAVRTWRFWVVAMVTSASFLASVSLLAIYTVMDCFAGRE